ncbi:MAG TPA: CoA transferase [Gammaproteobacteria bacterium]|jgi:crotonobetainyl-CoA:carnitine CoA-transferase CaiB-like acyl-CoA transferase|nr:CoA transferase [Gammaproteobacteria bacterium]
MPGPLDGVRIVDCSAVISGPLATMMLADQGADVIKVEPPGTGDITRTPWFSRGGIGALYANANRGKRSVALDLQAERGREILKQLVAGADVFVQNFRPGAMERLGLGEPELRAVQPELIYVSISGFGESGPYADRRVYDPVIQGLTGHIAVQRLPGDAGPVDLVRNIICDKSTSYTAAQAITAALFARERGHGGQHIKIAMIDAGLAFFWCDGMMAHTLVGEGVQTAAALYDIYKLRESADGPLVVFAASDSEFQGLARALDRLDLIEDERFKTLADRLQNVVALEEIVNAELRKWPAAELVERLVAEDVPAGPIHSLEEVIDDPQLRHNDAIVEFDHPLAGRMRQPAPPARFDRTPAAPGRPAPALGEHTDEVMEEIGVGDADRQRLREDDVIG